MCVYCSNRQKKLIYSSMYFCICKLIAFWNKYNRIIRFFVEFILKWAYLRMITKMYDKYASKHYNKCVLSFSTYFKKRVENILHDYFLLFVSESHFSLKYESRHRQIFCWQVFWLLSIDCHFKISYSKSLIKQYQAY